MRTDGFRLRNIDPFDAVMGYIMNTRVDSQNQITLHIPYSPIREYINERRLSDSPVSHLAILVAAYIRTVSQYPCLNRFFVNAKCYAREEMSVAMVVLKGSKIDASTVTKMYFNLDATLDDVNNTIKEYIESQRNTPQDNKTEGFLRAVVNFPGLLSLGVPFLKWWDKHFGIDYNLVQTSPFHNSMFITDLASIRTNYIYHHVYEFGTTSIFLSMGNLENTPTLRHGEVELDRTMPIGLVMDERIASGSYFAMAFQEIQKYLFNPHLLEEKPAQIVYDPALNEKQLLKFKKKWAAHKAKADAALVKAKAAHQE